MAVVTMRQLLEAGVHFGHQTRRWNPKMKPYLHGERAGIYIIDLKQTLEGINQAYTFVREIVGRGGTVLFVGTKKQAQDAIGREARRVAMPFVNFRWLGGMLTNFQTISSRIRYMEELRNMEKTGEMDLLPKKEALRLRREAEKLERNLDGIRSMLRPPDAVFVIDTRKEAIAVTEANKLGIPIVAVVDTNCDPDEITYVIPGNDDAIRAGALMARVIADACAEGAHLGQRTRRGQVQAPVEDEPLAAWEVELAAAEAAERAAAAERDGVVDSEGGDGSAPSETAAAETAAPAADVVPQPEPIPAPGPLPVPEPLPGPEPEPLPAPEPGPLPAPEPEPLPQPEPKPVPDEPLPQPDAEDVPASDAEAPEQLRADAAPSSAAQSDEPDQATETAPGGDTESEPSVDRATEA